MKFATKNHGFGEKTATFAKFLANFLKHAKFDENFEIRERCKGVHCVDLGERFPTRPEKQRAASYFSDLIVAGIFLVCSCLLSGV